MRAAVVAGGYTRERCLEGTMELNLPVILAAAMAGVADDTDEDAVPVSFASLNIEGDFQQVGYNQIMTKPWPEGLDAASSYVVVETLRAAFDRNFDAAAFNPGPDELSEAFREALEGWAPLRDAGMRALQESGAAVWMGDGTAHCVSPYAERFTEMEFLTGRTPAAFVGDVLRLQAEAVAGLEDDGGGDYDPAVVQGASRCAPCLLGLEFCQDAARVQGGPAENGCDTAGDDDAGEDGASRRSPAFVWQGWLVGPLCVAAWVLCR